MMPLVVFVSVTWHLARRMANEEEGQEGANERLRMQAAVGRGWVLL
jgi:hypothetical protein